MMEQLRPHEQPIEGLNLSEITVAAYILSLRQWGRARTGSNVATSLLFLTNDLTTQLFRNLSSIC
jgi:hypothetical protein